MRKVYPRRRKPRFCGEHGLTAAAAHAIASGSAVKFASPEEWLDAILEGEIKDTLPDMGWRSHCGTRRCRRAGRCRQFPHRLS
ncbi:MAG: hypothetical protein V2I51_02390 [Anderseniella sp.]|jgi:hypothetical protein|nr:hypothetical protein [Anderseniella sp.]